MLQDLHYALRYLRRKPLIGAFAVLTLGLGIGGASAVFTVVEAVLLKPLPFHDSDRLVRIWELTRDGEPFSFSEPNYLDLRAEVRALGGIAAIRELGTTTVLAEGGEPERILAVPVSFPAVLGVRPAIGRLFTEDDDRPGIVERRVVLSDGLWRRRFGADAAIVGRAITLDVASITPALRDVLHQLDPALPAPPTYVIDASRANAAAGPRFNLSLLGAFALIAVALAITGVYAMLAFTVVDRRREIAVRLALGASGPRIARDVLWNGLFLAVAGVGAGTAAALGGYAGAVEPVVRRDAHRSHDVRGGSGIADCRCSTRRLPARPTGIPIPSRPHRHPARVTPRAAEWGILRGPEERDP